MVGAADNIRAKLLELLEETNRDPSSDAATGFSFELCPPAGRVQREERLVLELHPVSRSGDGTAPRARRQRSTYTRENS